MLGELLELCQERRDAAGFEAAALGVLQRRIGFDVAYMSVKGNETKPTVVALEPHIVERAVSRAAIYLRDLEPVKQVALVKRGVAVDTAVLGTRSDETRYYRELGRAVGIRHSLLAYVPWRGNVIAAIMLGRKSVFTERDVVQMEEVLPALGATRATYGLSPIVKPLHGAVQPGLRSWFGLQPTTRRLASVATSSGTLVVRDKNGFREMVATNEQAEVVWTRAALDNPAQSGWPYIDLFHVAAAVAQRREKALFIGCGGGVALRQFATVYPGIALDVVEREAAVIDLARQWYALDEVQGLSVHVADGVDFVQRAPSEQWDIVVVDAYDTTELASTFVQRAFFVELRRVLRSGGAVAFNVIGSLDVQGPLPVVVSAARAVFSDVRVVPVVLPTELCCPHALRNIVVIAK